MGAMKKVGIIILIYVIAGVIFSAMIQLGYLPSPGGLEGPLNILYIIFQPITIIYFVIVIALGLYM